MLGNKAKAIILSSLLALAGMLPLHANADCAFVSTKDGSPLTIKAVDDDTPEAKEFLKNKDLKGIDLYKGLTDVLGFMVIVEDFNFLNNTIDTWWNKTSQVNKDNIPKGPNISKNPRSIF